MKTIDRLVPVMLVLLLAACGGDEEASTSTAPPASEAQSVAQSSPTTPVGADPTAEEMEQNRFSDAWRALESVQRARQQPRQPGAASPPQSSTSSSTFASRANRQESVDDISIDTIGQAPVLLPVKGDVAGPSILKTQVYLDHANFSPGVIDGRWGKNSAIAVYWFQHANGMEPTGEVDEQTFRALERKGSVGSVLTRHSVSKSDLEGPFLQIPDDPYGKAELDCLCYESAQEKLAEDFHTTPEFLAKLNPNVDFAKLSEGTQLVVPNVPTHHSQGKVAEVLISIEGNYFHGLDGSGNIIFHYPTTVGSEYDPSPREELRVTA
ncbi:MAG: peptidoglycan-binding protein, partial [Acidobacteria bacterium]|nr:peptidoglycan-binding protein [Acidobacteriota bacterium]